VRPESKILLVIAEPPIGGDVLILIYTNLLSKFKLGALPPLQQAAILITNTSCSGAELSTPFF
jgi:hypothetical protein